MSTITIRGVVTAQPQFAIDSEEQHHLLIAVSERLESGQLGTSYYVDATGILADNAADSVLQGDSLLITGELRIDQIPGTGHIVVAILPTALGHDLSETRSKRVL